MEQNFDASANEKTLNPWFSIWTQPRKTIRQIFRTYYPENMIYILAAAAGIIQALDRASTRNMGDRYPLTFILIASLLGGGFMGLVGLTISSWLVKLTGNWVGGKASYDDLLKALAWINIPIIWSLLLWIPKILLYGKEIFMSNTPIIDSSPLLTISLFIFEFIEIIISIWTFVITLKCISEVQEFSTWKALANVLLSGLIIIIPIMIVVLVTGI